jgi:hypothetical protein
LIHAVIEIKSVFPNEPPNPIDLKFHTFLFNERIKVYMVPTSENKKCRRPLPILTNLGQIDAFLHKTKKSDRNKRRTLPRSEIIIIKFDDY